MTFDITRHENHVLDNYERDIEEFEQLNLSGATEVTELLKEMLLWSEDPLSSAGEAAMWLQTRADIIRSIKWDETTKDRAQALAKRAEASAKSLRTES